MKNDILSVIGRRCVIPAILSLLCMAHAQDETTPPSPLPPPEQAEAAPVAPAQQPSEISTTNVMAEEEPVAVEESKSPPQSNQRKTRHREPLVRFGQNAHLVKGETTETMVVIGGDATVTGEVTDAVVAIGGNITLEKGAKARSAVAVLGNVTVEDGATVSGEAVAVGGAVAVAENGQVNGEVHDFTFGGLLPRVDWLQSWVRNCLFMLRPMSFKVGWVWGVAGIIFLFYALVALIFRRPIASCVDEINRRPATTFLMGVLAKILVPLILVLLAATGIGIIIIPFLLAALFLGSIIGKVAILQWLGLSAAKPFGSPDPRWTNPFVALAVGSLVVCLIYVVPILGLIAWLVFAVWGLGVGVLAALRGFRGEIPPPISTTRADAPPPYAPPTGYPGQTLACGVPGTFVVPPAGTVFGGNPSASTGAATADLNTAHTAGVPPFVDPLATGSAAGGKGMTAALPDVLVLPKASFWERMGAGFLDIVLVSIVGQFVGGGPLMLIAAIAYFAGMWTWRETTVGGVVLGLRVARLDNQPITFPVALIRALGGAFSIIVLFLGILNIAWDKDKQGWHDRIAGTVVLKLQKGRPLL